MTLYINNIRWDIRKYKKGISIYKNKMFFDATWYF